MLTEDAVVYYKFPYNTGDEPSGIIPLDSVNDVAVNSANELRFSGLSKKNEQREFIFKSEYARDVTKWKENVDKQVQEFCTRKAEMKARTPASDTTAVTDGASKSEKELRSTLKPSAPAGIGNTTTDGPKPEASSADAAGNVAQSSDDATTATNEETDTNLEEHNQVGGFHSPEKAMPVPKPQRGGSIIITDTSDDASSIEHAKVVAEAADSSADSATESTSAPTKSTPSPPGEGAISANEPAPICPPAKEKVPPSPTTAIVNKWQKQRGENGDVSSGSREHAKSIQRLRQGGGGPGKVAALAGKFTEIEEKSGAARPKPGMKLYGADLVKFLEQQGSSKAKVTEKRKMKWEVSSTGQWIVNGELASRSKTGNISVRAVGVLVVVSYDDSAVYIHGRTAKRKTYTHSLVHRVAVSHTHIKLYTVVSFDAYSHSDVCICAWCRLINMYNRRQTRRRQIRR